MPDSPPSTVRVVICDADPMARRVVREALEPEGIRIAGEVSDPAEAVRIALSDPPDVVLMDVLPNAEDGLDATQRICSEAEGVSVLVLTVADEAALGLRCLRAGASGFLSKEIETEHLPDEVRRVAAGEPSVSPVLAAGLIDWLRAVPEDGLGLRPVKSPLTAREWEVLDRLSAGVPLPAIAEEFVLSTETVRSHVKSILRKLGVRSRAEAVRVAADIRSSALKPPDADSSGRDGGHGAPGPG